MDFGVIRSIEVTQNLDTGEQVRLAQVTILDEDVVTVEMPFPEGDEFVPAAGDRVYFEEADEGLLVARCIQTVMDVDESLGEGERELFSRDGTSRSATIRMKNDQEIVLNAGTDYAIKYNELKTIVDGLVDDLASLWKLTFTHTHLYSPGPSPATQTATAAAYATSEAPSVEMSPCKVEKVRL